MKARCLLFFVYASVLCSTIQASADYLVTNRRVSVKREPSSASAPIIQIEAGVELKLLNDGAQTNGYYHVSGNSFKDGWIYRTFVRRYTSPPIQYVPDKVEVRVVDVGAGLCTLIKLTDGKYVIYDTGHKQWTTSMAFQQISAFIEPGAEIEMMVLSHNHADHMGGAADILKNYRVKTVIWPGYHEPAVSEQGPNSMNQKFLLALSEVKYPIEKINLSALDSVIAPGTTTFMGGAYFVFLCGFNKPPPAWLDELDGVAMRGERINSVSIVMKLVYRGNSVLFCGDAVGRHRGGPEDELIATEEYLVKNASDYLKSTVLISPHHGADNSNSKAFIQAVAPKVVIFSAGHEYNHPTAAAANRFLNLLSPVDIFRTDRGDDERVDGKVDFEWQEGRVTGCIDGIGDDDIHITLQSDGKYRVEYVAKEDPCAIGID